MTDYTELVKALRCCATMTCKGEECRYMILGCHDCFPKLHDDAAAAIEALQDEVKDAFDEGYNGGYTAGIGYCSFKRAKQPPQEVRE